VNLPLREGHSPGGYEMPSIAYTTATTPFGEVLLAAADRGVVALGLGNTEVELGLWLKSEFPGQNLQRDDGALHRSLAAALEALNGEHDFTIPLAVEGSEFQKRVWLALQRIPFGETRTYTQLAAMVGQPNAVRAVASACANNPVSILVPCHRVVGADGSLRGYRWGLERKQRLLDHEKQIVLSRQRSGMALSA